MEEPYSKGPVREDQSRHGVAEEECEPGPEAGPKEVAAAARAAHEAGPGVSIQLRDARHGRHGVHPTHLGDAGRPWRARPSACGCPDTDVWTASSNSHCSCASCDWDSAAAEPKGTLAEPLCRRVRVRCSVARRGPSMRLDIRNPFTEKQEKRENRTTCEPSTVTTATKLEHVESTASPAFSGRQDKTNVGVSPASKSNARNSASSLTRSGLEAATMHWKRWLEYV